MNISTLACNGLLRELFTKASWRQPTSRKSTAADAAVFKTTQTLIAQYKADALEAGREKLEHFRAIGDNYGVALWLCVVNAVETLRFTGNHGQGSVH